MSASLSVVVAASRDVADLSGRLDKIGRLAVALQAVPVAEIEIAAAFLGGQTGHDRLGVGPAALESALEDLPARKAAPPADEATGSAVTLAQVDATLSRIASATGAGSTGERIRLLRELFERVTPEERHFLARLIMGSLRQGALEGVLVDAIARATDVPVSIVRRAVMLTGDVPAAAAAAFAGGRPALEKIGMRLFRPLQPMLAQSADDVESALDRLGAGSGAGAGAAYEYKIDGARIQVHRSGEVVRVYTRNLNDVTASVPEVVEAVLSLPARDLVLDGEAIALRPGGRPHPFQTTMSRFGRRLDVERQRQEVPLTPLFFDCLHVDGESLIDDTAEARFSALDAIVADVNRVPRIVTADAVTAEQFLAAARGAGHEGVVAKALASPYEAGRRGRGWIKVKPAHTLDLVVLAAEWGHGRRTGWLSNLHLGARDPENGGFVMLGKTFKGLTDELLEWQTRRFQEIEIGRDRHTVHVRPEIVVEIAFNEVQASQRYPGGLALRFARVKAYRPDKRPDEADTIDTVRAIWRDSLT